MAKKVLIAEDEKPMARALELKLINSGYDAKAVHNGEEVIKELKKGGYNLLLLDLIMPVLDGFGTLEKIKKEKIKIKVIVSSNLSQEDDIKKAKSLGAVDFFIKLDTPLTKVLENVKKHIG